MVDGSLAAPRRSRRQLLLGGGSGIAGALALAACGGTPLREKVRGATDVSAADVELLNGLLGLEYHAIAAYTAAIPLLHPADGGRAAKQFLAQELAHALAIEDLVKKAKGKPVKPRASYDLGSPKSEEAVLRLLHELENAQLTGYLSMIPRLAPGRVRSAVAAIFANDAQHLAVLSARLGRSPAPSPFVTGHG